MKKAFTHLFFYCYRFFIVIFLLGTVTTKVNAVKLHKGVNLESKAALDQTVTFNALASRTYGDADFNVNATASSGLAVQYRSSNTAIATVNVLTGLVHILTPGTFSIIASQPGNATFNAVAVIQQQVINKATLNVKVNSQSRIYGVNNATLTIIYNGFKYNDTQTKLSVRPVASTTANTGSDVNSYPIVISQGSSSYYNLSYETGATITVTKAPLIITAANKAKIYGAANPALTLTYIGFKNNQNASALTTPANVTTSSDINTAPGTYDINVYGAASNNYAITFIKGTVTINKATLRVTAANKTKAYGANMPALTYTVTGYVLGQTSSVFTIPVNVSSTASAASPIGTYGITVAGATAANYNIIYMPGTLNVTKATLRITATNPTKLYGAVTPALTYTYTGFVLNETESNLTTTPVITTTVLPDSPVGSYPITIKGATASNYTITYVAGRLTIAKAPLKIIADAKTKIYKAAVPVLTYTYDGFVNHDNESSLTAVPVISTTATATSAAAIYPITIRGATAANYTITVVNSTLTVFKGDLTIKANNITRTYGAAVPAFTFTYTGFVDNDTESILVRKPTASAGVTMGSGAGTYTINPSGAASANYNIVYLPGTLTIEKSTLTIKVADKTKIYGAANPALTVIYSGLVNNDRASAILTGTPDVTTTATLSSVPADYAIVVSGNVTAKNYNITYANGVLAVAKATLRVTAANKTKVYGQPNPVLNYTYTGFVNGDDAADLTEQPLMPVTTAVETSPAANYPITVTGGISDKYTFQYVAGQLAVTKALLTATIDGKSKVYGEPTPNLTATYTGFVNGDNQASLTAQPAFATASTNSPVGTYAITGTGGTSANYNFRVVNSTLSITRAALTIKADDATCGYGLASPPFTLTYTGFVNDDNANSALSRAPVITTTATESSAQGAYPITASGAVSSNYTLTYTPGTLTITKAPLFVKADDKAKTYGDANPALTLSYSGFVNGDNASAITATPVANVTVNAGSNAGAYTITPSGGSTLNGSYDLVYQTGTLTINKAPLSIATPNATRAYGTANPVFIPVYTGFVNGQTAAVLTAQPVVNTTATANSDVGNYPISVTGAAAANYAFSYTPATLNVTAATLTITANNKSRAYGAGNPALDFTYSGFAAGDNVNTLTTSPTATTTATAASVIGNYAIVPSGAASANYVFAYNNGVLTVDKALLTVTADAKTKVYGTANPALTLSYSGFTNGETSSVITTQATATTAAATASGVGNYAIVPTGGAAANYNLVYTNGTLAVSKAPLTITANNQTKQFSQANPALTFTYSGFVNADGAASLITQPTATTIATRASATGTYPIVPAGAVDANYSFTYVSGTLAITTEAATINFALLPAKTFGDADFAPGATNSVNEPLMYTSSNAAVATIVNGNIHILGAGTTVITAAFPAASGYNQTTPATQLFVVNKAFQVITFNAIPLITRGENYTIPSATSSAGLPVILDIKDPAVASVRGLTISGLQIGSTTISAFQPGNNNYYAANTIVQTLQVKGNAGNVELQVHQAVSPNGDGQNDVFFIEGIKDHPDNQVTVINRNGVKIYETKGYDNASRVFDGHSSVTGTMQQPGTYFYLIEYMVNGQGRHLTGYFVLKY